MLEHADNCPGGKVLESTQDGTQGEVLHALHCTGCGAVENTVTPASEPE